jgi:hypothetical protein
VIPIRSATLAFLSVVPNIIERLNENFDGPSVVADPTPLVILASTFSRWIYYYSILIKLLVNKTKQKPKNKKKESKTT